MIKTDKIRKPQPAVFYIIDYLWSGFAGLSVAMVVVALWAWGSAVFGEFMLPAPVEVFQKPNRVWTAAWAGLSRFARSCP